GEEGECRPLASPSGLTEGVFTFNPRFPHRGIYAHGLSEANAEEWLRFFAKLKLNAVGVAEKYLGLARKFGFRCEVGGHGLTELIPRQLFQEKPEIFRMSQPEDFFGKRQADYNACLTNPEAGRIIKQAYKEKLRKHSGVYALHAWPEDLPGGGWCLCSRCRSLSPSDQALLAVRYLGEAVEEEQSPVRVPMLVYHDTIPAPSLMKPHAKSFLLFAPRERCYGHALNDPECRRNRFYLNSLQAWSELYQDIPDAHTFEYYLDQVLFRGMYPFLPEVILKDMMVYESCGIKSHMVLQVGGVSLAPEYNLLLFARGCWERNLTVKAFLKKMAVAIFPGEEKNYQHFLHTRSEIFQPAMRLCEYDPTIYFDYRWLPEVTNKFGQEMARVYQLSARKLRRAASRLKALFSPRDGQSFSLIEEEAGRAEYEAAEFEVMAFQQAASNCLGLYYQTGKPAYRDRTLVLLGQAIRATEISRKQAKSSGLPEDYYFFQCSRWLEKEFQEKIKVFSGGK
ncbi:MAG TPA: DUF4838 domain-containing protein, partial [bacterium]|nr:DUF4838 domain-containing protein [bacterium]